MECYLDNSATTVVFPSVKDKMVKLLEEDYGNPSSMHTKGIVAERYIKEARDIIAANLKVQKKEIVFTSGGTEANNLAIIGSALANERMGRHLITTPIEHSSVDNPMQFLEKQGFNVTYLHVDKYGKINLEELKEAITKDTILVSIMYVNNEIGSVQPIEKIGALIKRQNSKTLFHVDAVQAYGKYRINPVKEQIDLLSASAHKIHGPKGAGFLYIKDKTKIKPIVYGGGHEGGLRSGTENVPGIAGMGQAVKEIYDGYTEKIEQLYRLKERLVNGLINLPGVTLNGPTDRQGAPHVVSASFEGVRSEVLLHALAEREIYASAGSACSSNHPSVSSTLKAIGVRKELLDSTLRFSFGEFTNEKDIDACLQALEDLLPKLRKFHAK